MKYGSYYQIAHKETNEILSYMGETKFYSLDKAQETMSDFEYFDTLNNERMKKLSDAADAFLLDMKLNDTISRYMNLPKSKDYCIVERKGYLF